MRTLFILTTCLAALFAASGCILGGDAYIGHYHIDSVGRKNLNDQQALVRQIAKEIAEKLGRTVDFDLVDARQIQVIMKGGKASDDKRLQASIVLTSLWVNEDKYDFDIDFAKSGRAEDEIVVQIKSVIESVLRDHGLNKWQFGVTSWGYAR